jgi:hypoxanthine phosphoribosyltransferase
MEIQAQHVSNRVERDVREVLFSQEQLQSRVAELGEQISSDYNGLHPVMVGVLKGVLVFMSDLLRCTTIPVEVDFMSVSSYSKEARQQGLVRVDKDLSIPIQGRHVLFIEDIVDSGLTLYYLLKNLKSRQPASLEVCTLFNKSERRLVEVPLKYRGFELPDRFVVGYGLDYHEKYRNLPFVGVLKPQALLPVKENHQGM